MEIGMVVVWTLAADPSDKYLECNGQAVDSDKYPKLYALMHSTPDYRGVFLRGLGSITYSQFNGSLNGMTETMYSSDRLNEIQGDAIRNITGFHGSEALISNGSTGNHPFGGAFNVTTGFGMHISSDIGGRGEQLNFDASRVVATANENRPINRAVRYFIKAK